METLPSHHHYNYNNKNNNNNTTTTTTTTTFTTICTTTTTTTTTTTIRAETLLSEEEKTCPPFVDWVKEHEALPHFTYVIITLERTHRRAILSDNGAILAGKLARCYYYYLK